MKPLEIFARIDVQNRGFISFSEFSRALQVHSSLCRVLSFCIIFSFTQYLGFKYPLHEKSLHQLMIAFEEMDINCIGYVSKLRFYEWVLSKKFADNPSCQRNSNPSAAESDVGFCT